MIYQQLRKSDSCLEESFPALMHGSCSDGRLCVLEVCAARDSPLTNTVRQRLHDISVTERWTSRDHDLSKTAGRRSALQNLDLVRPEQTVFAPPFSGSSSPITYGRGSDREIHCILVQLAGSKKLSCGQAHVIVESASVRESVTS